VKRGKRRQTAEHRAPVRAAQGCWGCRQMDGVRLKHQAPAAGCAHAWCQVTPSTSTALGHVVKVCPRPCWATSTARQSPMDAAVSIHEAGSLGKRKTAPTSPPAVSCTHTGGLRSATSRLGWYEQVVLPARRAHVWGRAAGMACNAGFSSLLHESRFYRSPLPTEGQAERATGCCSAARFRWPSTARGARSRLFTPS